MPAACAPSVPHRRARVVFTRMSRAPSSLESTLVIVSSAPFVAAYTDGAGRRIVAHHRAHVDHVPARRAEQLERLLREEERAEHVDVELAVELVLGHVLDRRECEDTGVVDEDVELPIRALRLLDQAEHIRGLRDIAVHGDCHSRPWMRSPLPLARRLPCSRNSSRRRMRPPRRARWRCWRRFPSRRPSRSRPCHSELPIARSAE